MKRQAASSAKMQTKRIALRVREQAARQVLEQARLRLAQMVGRGGRLAYNNQVSTRLLRRQTEIRKMIYDGLWTKES